MFTLETNSAEETVACGRRFAKTLRKNDIVLLEGALGGGKTTFVKGILAGLGYKKSVLSPTFTLLRQYKLKGLSINHLDLYRLSEKEADNEEFREYLYPAAGDSVILVEWGDKVEHKLDAFIKAEFQFLAENKRKLVFSLQPSRPARLAQLQRCFEK